MDIIDVEGNSFDPNLEMKFKGEFMFWIIVLGGRIQGRV